MKNIISKYIGILLIVTLFFNCQNLEQPEFSDFLYDGPVITLTSPSPSGATVVRSKDPIAPITIKFQVEDDLGIAIISVKLDNVEIANMTEFTNSKLVIVDDLTKDVSTGSHTLTITVTDTNNVVATKTTTFEKIETPPYEPVFDSEIFYMAFDGDFSESISGDGAVEVGTPGFTTDAYVGSNAYIGATDSYLTFPTTGLLGNEFSATFWYKMNNTSTNRAGILTVGPEDTANPTSQNKRTSGFRLFREGGDSQSLKLNVGNGTNDGTAVPASSFNLTNSSGWVHIAFTLSQTKTIIYINGVLAKELDRAVDWTGCDILSIMSGAPRFAGWNHKSDLSTMDELRLFNKALNQNDITKIVADGSKIFNMPFNGSFLETISKTDATVVGTPSFTTIAKEGSNAYAGATDSYLTFPTAGLLGNQLSATFWYKVNAAPTSAGLLVIGPTDEGKAADKQNNRKSGFRFFREGSGTAQTFKLNVGNGTADSWFDGGAAARIDPTTTTDWVHLAFTISGTECIVYINGQVAKQGAFTGVDWTGCDIMSIMSGAPRFTEWGHKSDLSNMDGLALYKKALSQVEIQALMN